MKNVIRELLNVIESKGFRAYVVGGYPRDLYIGKKSDDVDICTSATPKDLKDIFFDAILPKEEYGSVTLFYKKVRFEITTFRTEFNYINNRIPGKINYIDDLESDLKRRDFTVNTICLDKHLNYIDLLDGRADIKKRIIRTVIDANTSMQKDALRILRAVRFATVLDFNLDEELKEAIKNNKDLLLSLSYFRKKSELDKIFNSKNYLKGLKLIDELGLTKPLELGNLDKVTNASILGIWALIDVNNKYPFNKVEREQILHIRELLDKDILDRYNLYHYGLYVSEIAGELKGITRKQVTKAYNSLPIKDKKEIDITADEIVEILGIKKGPILREIYFDLESKILYNKLNNKKKILKAYVVDKYK